MGPVSATTLATQLFESFSQIEDFKYNIDELWDFYSQTKKNKFLPKARSSSYQAFRSAHKGVDKDTLPKWEDIKNNPEEFAKYTSIAEATNNDRGFSDTDPKISKKKKSDDRKNAIRAAITIAQQKKTKSEEKPEENPEEKPEENPEENPEEKPDENPEEKPEEKPEENPEEKPEENPEENPEEKPEEKPEGSNKNVSSSETDEEDVFSRLSLSDSDEDNNKSVKDTIFDKIDENGDGVISREEFEKFTENSNSDNEDEMENIDEDEIINDDKPEYTGKTPHTALSNFKQWVLQEKKLEFNSTVKKADMDEYKKEYNCDPKKYDAECPWFEFIKNNMRLE